MRERIQRFVQRCLDADPGRAAVEREALELLAWQREHNTTYASFCADARPTCLQEIPALPVALFRELPFCCFPPERARRRFHTSGTTTGAPGVHRLLDTRTYDLASAGWFRRWFPAAPAMALSLIPSPIRAPNSSLSHMVGLLCPDVHWLAEDGELADPEHTWWLLAAQRQPVFLAATALSLAALLDAPGDCRLPDGSLVMTTGGSKGRQLEIDPTELLREASTRLGGARLVGEYGMTELCSQLWTRPEPPNQPPASAAGPFYPPPWLVPIPVEPGTGEAVDVGQPGQLRFVDLANDHSVLAIETMDRGTLLPDGGLLLHGRLPGAAARGCSLSVEEALRAARGGG